MSASSPVPADHPLMVAWEAYKATDDYANTKKWAGHDDQATDGSLWASFERGWLAAGGRRPFAPPAAGAPPALVALVQRQVELLGQCEAFIAEQFDADDRDAVALSNAILAIRKTLESSVLRGSPAPAPVAPPAETHYIVGRVDHGDDEVTTACGVTLSTWDAPVKKGVATFDRDRVTCGACQLTAPPAVAGGDAMPEIRVGDWVALNTRYETDSTYILSGLNRVTSEIETENLNQRGHWYKPLPGDQPKPDVSEIRGERHGRPFIWRRRQEGQ